MQLHRASAPIHFGAGSGVQQRVGALLQAKTPLRPPVSLRAGAQLPHATQRDSQEGPSCSNCNEDTWIAPSQAFARTRAGQPQLPWGRLSSLLGLVTAPTVLAGFTGAAWFTLAAIGASFFPAKTTTTTTTTQRSLMKDKSQLI